MGFEKVDRTVETLLAALGLGTVAAQARVARSWGEIVGPLLAVKTCPARLKAGVLTVNAVSSAWAQEVSLARSTVLERIGQVLGAGLVREIRVVAGPVPEDEGAPAPKAQEPGDVASLDAPEGIGKVADPEMRQILSSLSRKAASRKP